MIFRPYLKKRSTLKGERLRISLLGPTHKKGAGSPFAVHEGQVILNLLSPPEFMKRDVYKGGPMHPGSALQAGLLGPRNWRENGVWVVAAPYAYEGKFLKHLEVRKGGGYDPLEKFKVVTSQQEGLERKQVSDRSRKHTGQLVVVQL